MRGLLLLLMCLLPAGAAEWRDELIALAEWRPEDARLDLATLAADPGSWLAAAASAALLGLNERLTGGRHAEPFERCPEPTDPRLNRLRDGLPYAELAWAVAAEQAGDAAEAWRWWSQLGRRFDPAARGETAWWAAVGALRRIELAPSIESRVAAMTDLVGWSANPARRWARIRRALATEGFYTSPASAADLLVRALGPAESLALIEQERALLRRERALGRSLIAAVGSSVDDVDRAEQLLRELQSDLAAEGSLSMVALVLSRRTVAERVRSATWAQVAADAAPSAELRRAAVVQLGYLAWWDGDDATAESHWLASGEARGLTHLHCAAGDWERALEQVRRWGRLGSFCANCDDADWTLGAALEALLLLKFGRVDELSRPVSRVPVAWSEPGGSLLLPLADALHAVGRLDLLIDALERPVPRWTKPPSRPAHRVDRPRRPGGTSWPPPPPPAEGATDLGQGVFELPEGIEEPVGLDMIAALVVRGSPEAFGQGGPYDTRLLRAVNDRSIAGLLAYLDADRRLQSGSWLGWAIARLDAAKAVTTHLADRPLEHDVAFALLLQPDPGLRAWAEAGAPAGALNDDAVTLAANGRLEPRRIAERLAASDDRRAQAAAERFFTRLAAHRHASRPTYAEIFAVYPSPWRPDS